MKKITLTALVVVGTLISGCASKVEVSTIAELSPSEKYFMEVDELRAYARYKYQDIDTECTDYSIKKRDIQVGEDFVGYLSIEIKKHQPYIKSSRDGSHIRKNEVVEMIKNKTSMHLFVDSYIKECSDLTSLLNKS